MSNHPTITAAANVRAEMARREVSQTAMAAVLGVSQSQLSKRLKGTIPFDINELTQIAHALNVPLAQITAGIETAA